MGSFPRQFTKEFKVAAVRRTGGPEVLNWTPVRRLARELKQQN